MRIAIPRFDESVAPCFEYSATMAIFTVEEGQVIDQIDVRLQSRVAYDRARLMKAEHIDTVICGGVQSRYEDLLRTCGIEVISWVSGDVGDLLGRFLEGRLTAGTARLGIPPQPPEPTETRPQPVVKRSARKGKPKGRRREHD